VLPNNNEKDEQAKENGTYWHTRHTLFFKPFLRVGLLKKYQTSSALLLLGRRGEPNRGRRFELGVEDVDPGVRKPGVDGIAGALRD